MKYNTIQDQAIHYNLIQPSTSTIYHVRCILLVYNVRCTMYDVQCTMYDVVSIYVFCTTYVYVHVYLYTCICVYVYCVQNVYTTEIRLHMNL